MNTQTNSHITVAQALSVDSWIVELKHLSEQYPRTPKTRDATIILARRASEPQRKELVSLSEQLNKIGL